MSLLLITLVVVIVLLHVDSSNSLKVCNSFRDYALRSSENCYDNPDGESNTTEIIRRWGFTAEEYYITTEDGYKVLLNRAYDKITKPNPIFFVHGIAMNSRGFVVLGNKSLPHILGKMGYDVYIMNCRGTLDSRQHVNLTTNDNKYWKFSFHQMAIYDVRSAIELINAKSKAKVIYIGFSMGTTISYIYSSLFPQEANERVRGIISLAPVAYLNNIRSIVGKLAPLWPPTKPFIYLLKHGEVSLDIISKFCPISTATMFICLTGMAPIFGDDSTQADPLTLRVNLKIGFDGIGAEVITHYTQIIKTGRFQQYDFGKTKNLKVYNQTKPPLYKLGKILVPVSLIVGANDLVATEKNAKKTYNEINNKCGYTIVPWKKWCHSDFVGAKDVDTILAPLIIDKIRQFENGVCNL